MEENETVEAEAAVAEDPVVVEGDAILTDTAPAPASPAGTSTSWSARVFARPTGSTGRLEWHDLGTGEAASRQDAEQKARAFADQQYEHVHAVQVSPI